MSEAIGYTLAASTASDNPPSVRSSSNTYSSAATSATVFEDAALSPNTTYYLFVRADARMGASTYTVCGSTVTLAAKPGQADPVFSGV